MRNFGVILFTFVLFIGANCFGDDDNLDLYLVDLYRTYPEFRLVAVIEQPENENLDLSNLPSSFQINFEKDMRGQLNMNLISPSGRQMPLTFGTLILASTEAILGHTLDQAAVKKGKALTLYFEKDQNGNLVTMFSNESGLSRPFTFDRLLAALPQTLEDTGNVNQTDTRRGAKIYFEKINGVFQPLIKHVDGRIDPLNLGTLIDASAELVSECRVGTEINRTIDITLLDLGNGIHPIQVDAYGKIEDLSLDNLITAVAETLQICQQEPKRPLMKTPQERAIAIKLEKTVDNKIHSYLVDSSGKKKELNLGTLLSASNDLVENAGQENQKNYLEISLEKNEKGNMIPLIINSQGKAEELNLMNLILAACSYCREE